MTTLLPMSLPRFQASNMQEMSSGLLTKLWTLSQRNAPTQQARKKMEIAQTLYGLRQESRHMLTTWESEFQEHAIAVNQEEL